MTGAAPKEIASYRVTGMDCSSCVAKIENAARSTAGVEEVRVSLATQTMTVAVDDAIKRLPAMEGAIQALGYRLARVRPEGASKDDDEDLPKILSHLTPSYRRALWIVVALNIGYGLVELIGGFIAGSQAVKADALDFLGDGSISFLGLLAFGWSADWRARSALIQGYFLGALGFGVTAFTLYRFLYQQTPEPELMGALGFVALLINIIAAIVLLPHRSGDANTRAVWLFSRNDAIGNAAVVVAAGLVWWHASPWPDLIVALIIAGLFLHSAFSIIRDASSELRGKSA
jgi:Co/Zn/Cd efflux system component/copper chaperone CopZ